MVRPERFELMLDQLPTLFELMLALFNGQKLRIRLQHNGGELLEILIYQVRRVDTTQSWEVLGRPVSFHKETYGHCKAWFRTDFPQGYVELTTYEEN